VAHSAAGADIGSLADCRAVAADTERLACYDRWASPPAAATPVAEAAATPAPSAPPAALTPGSLLSRFWELQPQDKRGTFRLTAYRSNYFLPVHVTSQLNRSPNSPTQNHQALLNGYRRTETKLQISLRTKLAEDVGLPGGDVWFGYTQQSLWQLWTKQESSPFRSTDYEPELIYVVPVPRSLGGLPADWHLSLMQLGIAHQSNGQSAPLSRSWNRVYAGLGLENDHVTLLGRIWRRLPESADKDDNPDLGAYRGRGDLQLLLPTGRGTTSVLYRSTFRRLNRGALQLDYSVPISRQRPDGLRWYVQVFTGYGETLLDYNFRQTSFGLGVSLLDF
jgi:phospholipase A1